MKSRNLAVCGVMLGALVSVNAVAQSEAQEDDQYYNDRYCMTCHGADGMGSEGINAPRLAGMEKWYLKRQLENFRAGIRGTHEMDLQGREMRPMAMPLTDASIADLLEWVGGWEYKPTQVTLAGDADAGRSLYTACAACHGDAAQGNEAKFGVYTAYRYYKKLLKKLQKTPSLEIKNTRIRVSDYQKVQLLARCYVKYRLNII